MKKLIIPYHDFNIFEVKMGLRIIHKISGLDVIERGKDKDIIEENAWKEMKRKLSVYYNASIIINGKMG